MKRRSISNAEKLYIIDGGRISLFLLRFFPLFFDGSTRSKKARRVISPRCLTIQQRLNTRGYYSYRFVPLFERELIRC